MVNWQRCVSKSCVLRQRGGSGESRTEPAPTTRAAAIAHEWSIGLLDQPGRNIADALPRYFHDRHMLLGAAVDDGHLGASRGTRINGWNHRVPR